MDTLRFAADRLILRQLIQNTVQFAFRLETHTRNLWQLHIAFLDRYPISESTERLKNSWIGFVAPQTQTGGDVQRHLMSTVRNAADWRPSIILKHSENSKVFDQAVAQSAIELQDVAIRPQLRVANQISRVLQGKQVFARGHWFRIMIRELSLQLKVQGVARFLIPAKTVRGKSLRISDSLLQIKSPIGIHRQLIRILQDLDHRFYSPQVHRKRRSTDFHLHHGIPKIEISAHLIL